MIMFAQLSITVAALSLALIVVVRHRDTIFRIRNSYANGVSGSHEQRENNNSQVQPGIVLLAEEDRDGFLQVWDSVCSRFTSDPKRTVCYADLLMSDIVGYPGPGSHKSAELKLDRETTAKYRRAHEIASHDRLQNSNPEELALAMNLYVAVLAEVLSAQNHSFSVDRHACHQ